MSNGITLLIAPQGTLAEALNTAAHAALPKDGGRSSNRRRKKRVEVRSPATQAPYELLWWEVVKSERDQSCAFSITNRMADHLLGHGCLTENLLLPSIVPSLCLFKQAIAQQFPDLREDLAQLSIEHCTVSQLQADFPFLFDSEAEVIRAFHELFVHSKVMLDGREQSFSARKKTIINDPSRVHTSDAQRWAFTIDLPFGTATIKLIRSWDDCAISAPTQ